MIMERTSRGKRSPGLPMPNNPKRNTQAKMLISMTFLMPNLCKKKGIVRMNRVSDTWEMESRRLGCFTPNEPGYRFLKSSRKVPPNKFVICREAPRNMAKRKKMTIFRLLKRIKASRPREEDRLLFSLVFAGGQAGSVNA